MKSLISIFLILITSALSFGQGDIPKTPVKVRVDRLDNKLVLSFKNHEGWHTYWKNPGDAGLPISYEMSQGSEKIILQELEWPVPKKYIEQGNMLAYGHSGEYSLFFALPQNTDKSLKIALKWLVCKHICIPGKIDFEVFFTSDSLSFIPPVDFIVSKNELKERLDKLPQKAEFPLDLDLVLAKDQKSADPKLNLYYTFSGHKLTDKMKHLGLLTPFPVSPFNFQREILRAGKGGNLFAKHPIEWDGEYVEPEIPLPLDGVYKTPYTFKFLYANPNNDRFEVIEKTFSEFSLTAGERLDNFFSMLSKDFASTKNPAIVSSSENNKTQEEGLPLWKYLLFAFIGGLILNFMPCVLPVISIKLFGLILHQGESRKRILAHNLTYSLGVISTFVAFALIILAFKNAGESIGWGFQLQSPIFVSVMIITLFIFTLNLFGLFEFRTPGGSKLGNVQTNDGFVGDFLSGVLATILSTPCSAPFLGTALTFAFTSPSNTIILVFVFIGLGLSSPFLLTGFFPKMISFFPRPGKWIEDFKKFLGLSLILTTVWLMDIFSSLVDTSLPMLKMNSALAMLFFSIYMLNKIVKKKAWTIPFFMMTAFLFSTIYSAPMGENTADHILKDKIKGGLLWEKWSEEKVDEYRKSGEIVFIDFTAKWCFTCKVNEKLVLDTTDFKNLVKKRKVKLLLGDWTKRDPIIGNWLRERGRVGVPAYFILNSSGELIDLGETITINKIRSKLR